MTVRPGFSLIEVLVALTMAGITITSLLALMSTLQRLVYNDSTAWKNEQRIVNTFADYDAKDPLEVGKPVETKDDNHTVTYAVVKPHDSKLSDIKDLVIEKVTVDGAAQDTWIKIAYRPKPEDKPAASPTPAAGVKK